MFKGRQWSQENLFKQAEVALFTAKDEGRNTIRFFSPQMQSMVDAHAAVENGLRAALANAAFRLFYQPQVDAGGRVTGAEALIRWVDEDGRFVSPAAFIATSGMHFERQTPSPPNAVHVFGGCAPPVFR